MQVEPFDPARHYDAFCAWTRWYQMTPLALPFLPATGFVVAGVAMGFLYKTDSKMAWIENLAANPVLPRGQRTEGLDVVVAAVIDEARRQGFEVLIGYTNVQAVIDRALTHGFTTDPERFQVVTKAL